MDSAEADLLADGYIWHHSHIQDDTMAGFNMDFAGGAHALVIQTNGGDSRCTNTTGKVNVANFGIENNQISGDDILYNDNFGDMTMATTDGVRGAAYWANITTTGADRYISNGDGGFNQRVVFDYSNWPADGGYPSPAWQDTLFENDVHMNGNAVIFG